VSTFEFVTVLMSIVVGLGITRVLSGLSSLVEHRANVRLDAVTLAWAVNVLGFHLIYWWIVVNNWRTLEQWSFARFAPLFLYGVLLYFCAALVLPDTVTPGTDLRARFESIRRPFFVFWFLVMCSELADSLFKGTDYVWRELGPGYLCVMAASFSLIGGALRTSDRRYHLMAALAFFAIYAIWTTIAFATI
jgi:hypothetical protein